MPEQQRAPGTSSRIEYCTGSTLPIEVVRGDELEDAADVVDVDHGVNGSQVGRGSMPAAQQRDDRAASSAAVWPLSSMVSVASFTDSNAHTTKRQPLAASSGQSVGVPQDVLDLHGAVERESGNAVVHRCDDPARVVHAVEEVGIAERHVAGAGRDLLRRRRPARCRRR